MSGSVLVKGGTVVDGTGAAPYEADVEIVDGKIARIGKLTPGKHEVIDARGKLVTPGFVDPHTHYDGQVTWEDSLMPSTLHGVTTVLMGNCGVGFAPCKPEHRELLVELMEAIEDIPGPVLRQGLPWNWQSFPDYLDALSTRRYDMDIATQLTHGALRVNVMGERAVRREGATADDLAAMARLAGEAVRAGAFGFSTSRTRVHKTARGEMTPDFMAAESELQAIGAAMKQVGRGVLQTVTDITDTGAAGAAEFNVLRRWVQASGRPLSMNVNQRESDPAGVHRFMDLIRQANADGLPIKAQVMGRPIGLVLGFELTHNPFSNRQAWQPLAPLAFAERYRLLCDPAVRARLLAEPNTDPVHGQRHAQWDKLFPVNDNPDYEPRPQDSVAARAAREGISPEQWGYDFMLANGGRNMLYRPLLNYAHYNLDDVYTMLKDPNAVPGIGDGGAHCGMTCDSSITTYNIAYWTRDRTLGPRLPLEKIIKGHTLDSARLIGLNDRGRIASGLKGDINVIDYERLRIFPLDVAYDLPGGARRLIQRAQGYAATLVSGVPILRDDTPTGARPGRLLRSGEIA